MTFKLFRNTLGVILAVLAAFVVGLFIMTNPSLGVRAQDNTTASNLCQVEGATISVKVYVQMTAYDRVAGHTALLTPVNANQYISIGECATANSTGIQYIYFQSTNQSIDGYVRLGDLQLAVQPPATPTPVVQATTVPSISAAQPTLAAVAVNSCQPYTVTVGDNIAYQIGDLVSGVDAQLWADWSATFVANDTGTTRGHGRVIHYAQSTCGSQEYANFAMGGIHWNDHGSPSWTGTIPNTYPQGYVKRMCGSQGYCSQNYTVG